INKNQQLCTDHDLLYGDGINNESFTSHIWGVINDIKKEKASSAYRINIIRGRVSSINVVYAGQNMDILFAVVPYEKIPDLIDLNNHENKEIIKNNLNLMDSLINDMIKINGIFYNQRRQIYSNMFGYLSGSILFVMAAKICLIYPFGELNFLLQKFFQIYSAWAWPLPLIIEDITNTEPDIIKNFNDFWDFNKLKLNEESSKSGDKMPILTSLFPEQNTAHNVNEFTLKIILREIKEAYHIMDELNFNNKSNLEKLNIFDELNYKSIYEHFILIECISLSYSNPEIRCSKVKSRVRIAITKWVDEEVNNVKLKDCLEEYHVLTGYEFKRTIKHEKFQELRRKILTKDMPTSSSATFNHNTPFNNKIKIEDKEINEIK
uniref:polynucleotide adenylyltransferase n=1 Tax=Meloidogyne floridensis TaxID=298350 RepID=A0A915NZH3_9BILA